MTRLKISSSNDFFECKGRPFFLLADTVWSAFSNTDLIEWETYLDFRREQGFNAVQISILPILHDCSDTALGLLPFGLNPDGTWNYSDMHHAFFDRAAKMLELAVSKGFVPCLVVLWGNYVPGNWMSRNNGGAEVIPFERIKPFATYIAKLFSPYHPVYYISGDTNFEDATGENVYLEALRAIKEIDTDALTAMHIYAGSHSLPDSLLYSPLLDFFVYQSGHHIQDQHMTYELALGFAGKPVKKPIFNAEPCYEGHGHGGRYGRFDAFSIRYAFWSSILAGARAGFAYGAHGIWSWHKTNAEFKNKQWSQTPYDWQKALRLQGAWDVCYAKWIVEHYELHALQPNSDLLHSDIETVRMATSNGKDIFAIYVPYAMDIVLNMDLSGYKVIAIELNTRYVMNPRIVKRSSQSIIQQIDCNHDVLIIGCQIAVI